MFSLTPFPESSGLNRSKLSKTQIIKNPYKQGKEEWKDDDNNLDIICLGGMTDPDETDFDSIREYFNGEGNYQIDGIKLFMCYNAEEDSIYWYLNPNNDMVMCWNHQSEFQYACNASDFDQEFSKFEWPVLN